MNFKQLEAFLVVANLKSFRQAAEHLFTSQPAISSRIANLESAIGVRLLERNKTSVTLTARGQDLLPYAEKVLRAVSTFREKADADALLNGVIRLGVAETIVHTWLPDFLRAIDVACPKVDVEITVDVTANLRDDLLSRSIDLAFLQGPLSAFSLESVHRSSFPIIWVTSPDIAAKQDGVITSDELARYRLLTHGRKSQTFIEVYSYFRDRAELPVRIVPSNSMAACVRMTVDGLGIAALPREVVLHEIQDGELIELKCDWHPSELEFTASFPSDPYNPITQIAVEISGEMARQYEERK